MTADASRFVYLVAGAEVSHIGPESVCYKLPKFPPPADFATFVDAHGEPVCLYGDHKWRIGCLLFNFGAEPSDLGPNGQRLTIVNAEVLKRCLCWFMYGDRHGVSVSTLMVYHSNIKRIFAFCSGLTVPIAASDLSRFFDTLKEALSQAIRPSAAKCTVHLLHELWLAREYIGVTLLKPEQIADLAQLIPHHAVQQTQFIPPRIWAYQSGRMHDFLEGFVAHQAQFQAIMRELLDAYRDNFGSLSNAREGNRNRRPCNMSKKRIIGCRYLGTFSSLAARHGISDLLSIWLFGPGTAWDDIGPEKKSVSLLSQYFNAVGLVGLAYVQCFSGMRIAEALSLRCNCLTIERDAMLGEVHVLNGETTKTTRDDDARWLAAPTVSLAIEAMAAVSRWRVDIAVELGDVPLSPMDRANPYLVQRAYEPWAGGGGSKYKKSLMAPRPAGYEIGRREQRVAGLFEEDAMRITADDEAYASRFSSNSEMSRYGKGCIWHIASHQYRRTAAVMMGASQVSLEAQQYQFKHLTSSQSGYYRRGSNNLRLNRAFTHELVETRFELVSLEFGLLNGPEYVSPISQARKDAILNFHEVTTGDAVQKAIKKGQLAVKQTLFGVCTRRDNCPYGGHDNYAHCPDCNDALLSTRKRSGVEKLGKTIAVRLIDAPIGTPLRAQLERSATAIERFMNVTA